MSRRGALENLGTTIAIPTHLSGNVVDAKTFLLRDERYQRHRVGYTNNKYQFLPAVSLGHRFAETLARNSDEYWGAFLTRPFTFRRSPQNSVDPNAIIICTENSNFPHGFMFLGYLSRQIAACLAPILENDIGSCALNGVAGAIQIEVRADCIATNSPEYRYLRWVEAVLELYREGVRPMDLPMCPADLLMYFH